jgi:hypothetical protein
MLFAPWIVDALRWLRADREPLMIGAAMRKASMNADRLARAALVLRLAQAVRACRACSHVDDCMRWYDDDGNVGAAVLP